MRSVRYVVRFDERDALDARLVGNKAKNLAELARRGFPVPRFFCVTTRAFREFVKSAGVEGLPPEEAREVLASSPVPEPVALEIAEEYRRWGGVASAVRSSATGEDSPEVSWAGQLDSFLGVEGQEALLEAVRKCWCSLWKENVLVYCRRKGIPHHEVSLGVIVQEMVRAELSGVAFTADPVTGGEGIIVEPELEGKLRQELTELLRAIEAHYGFPQDVEWAYEGGRFYVLQARPITTVRPVWTRAFFDERFPHPVSPLGWSVLGDLVRRRAFVDPLRYLGYEDPDEVEIFRLIRGRPYVLVEVFRALYRHIPRILAPYDWERYFPGGRPEGRLYFLRPGPPLRRFLSLLLSFLRDHNWILPLHYLNWRAFLRWYVERLGEVRRLDLKEASDRELTGAIGKLRHMVDRFLRLHRWSITWAEVLCGVLGRTVGDRSTLLSLIVSFDRTSRMNYAIWRLSKEGGSVGDLIRAYGHRAGSLDISFPTWEEDPGFLLGVVERAGDFDLEGRMREALRRRDEALRAASARLGPPSRALLRLLLSWTRRMVLLREEQRFYWQMAMAEMRKVFLEFGRRFVERGILDGPEDIFFLRLEEFRRALDGGGPDLRGKVAERKRRKKEDERVLPPQFVVGSAPLEAGPAQGGKVLKGMGISPGRAEGRAWVAPDLRDIPRAPEGEVLVTTSVDPGLTPVLITVSGLVLETGGALSHGAIVARELGVPAVAGVEGASRLIPQGARVAVDGDRGEVVLIESLR